MSKLNKLQLMVEATGASGKALIEFAIDHLSFKEPEKAADLQSRWQKKVDKWVADNKRLHELVYSDEVTVAEGAKAPRKRKPKT